MNDYTFKTKKHDVMLNTMENGIIRLWIDPTGKTAPKEYTVLPGDLMPAEVAENDNEYILSTNNVKVTVSKDNGRITLCDSKTSDKYTDLEYAKSENGAFILKCSMRKNDHIYGLGEDNDIAFGSLDRRGTTRDMITGQRINQNHVTADFPIPFILNAGENKPYGMYIDNPYNLKLDIGKSEADICTINSPGGQCCIYFIAKDTVPGIVNVYTQLIGRAELPPLWVLGYMQSKCSFHNWEEIDDAIHMLVKNNIPLDSIVFDFDWAQYFNNYKWNDRWKGLSPEKIRYYREKYGIHFMASNSGPMLKKDSDTFDSAVEAGILAHDTDGNTVTCGHYSGELMDFTNPDIEGWIEPQLKAIMDDGIEGWWLDLTEPEGDAENTVYYKGSKEEIHNTFSNECSDVYHNVMKKHSPNKRSFVLTRTGIAGIQRNPTALWTGDVYSEYGTLKAHIPEALNTSLSGISMWTCDTGGFLSPTNNSECPYNLYHNDRVEHAQLFERWLQFSCFTPILRSHHAGGEAVPTRYQDITLDGMSHYIKLRYKLIPYIYSLYFECFSSGTPLMRSLFWHYPDDKKAYSIADEYLFGEYMLVAPVLEAQANTREVYFPEGTWYDFDYDYVYEGGKTYTVHAPQNRIPVFVKAGGIIPMSDVVHNTRELDLSELNITVYPEQKSSFRLYADDGITENYLGGEYTTTDIVCEEKEDSVSIKINQSNNKYKLKRVIFNIHMKKAPEAVMLNNSKLEAVGRLTTIAQSDKCVWWFDRFNRMLHIGVNLTDISNTIDIMTDNDACFEEFVPFSEESLTGQLPYIYPPAAIPSQIQAIHYDRGGEGIAFHKKNDVDSECYRDDNAGIAFDPDKNRNYISTLEAGEWLEYTVHCNTGGVYRITSECRTDDKSQLRVSIGMDVSEKMSVENNEWNEEIIGEMPINNGEQIIRVSVLNGSVDMSTIKIDKII